VLRLAFEPDATLELVAESPGADGLDMPDNLCVSPHGELYTADDGGGENFIRRIDRGGRVVPFARNVRSQSELAGLCFSPDGRTLFANIQQDGITLAIRGPFEREQALHGFGFHAGLAMLAGALRIRRRRERALQGRS
jgi:secreted PhoX family phosphatase